MNDASDKYERPAKMEEPFFYLLWWVIRPLLVTALFALLFYSLLTGG